ncbi:SHOCT domain-containing protein [Petrachloros mirabilis]
MVHRQLTGVRNVVLVLLSACVVELFAQACQGPTQSSRVACGSCEDKDRIVRLQTAPHQGGQPAFTHPFLLSPEDWKSILKSIHVQSQEQGFLFLKNKGPVEPAFTDDEIEYLSATLSRVFRQAQPDERVVFAMSRHPSADLTEVTSGAWSVNGPSLHFVLANYRYAVTMPAVLELVWRDPLWTKAGPFYDLVAGDYQTVEGEEGSLAKLFSVTLPVLSIAYKPLLLSEPPASDAVRNSPTGKESFPSPSRVSPPNMSVEERLQALKRMKDQGLITEEEYRVKKQQLLDRF